MALFLSDGKGTLQWHENPNANDPDYSCTVNEDGGFTMTGSGIDPELIGKLKPIG